MTHTGVSGAVLLIALLVGCGGRDPTIRPDATRPVATTSARPPAAATPASVGDFGRDRTCPGDGWPPFSLPEAVPGLTARSTDQAHGEIRNGTDRAYHVWVSGWQVAQLETCRGLVEREVARRPSPPGAAFIVDLPSDLAGFRSPSESGPNAARRRARTSRRRSCSYPARCSNQRQNQ